MKTLTNNQTSHKNEDALDASTPTIAALKVRGRAASVEAQKVSLRKTARSKSEQVYPMPMQELRELLPLAWTTSYLAHLIVKPVELTVTRQFDLSWLEWRIVMTLGLARRISANQLISAWGFEKMAASRGVKRLLERGLVERTEDPADSRRRPLHLTTAGATVFGKLWPGAKAHYQTICSTLDEGEFEAFCHTMDKMILQAERAYAETQTQFDGGTTVPSVARKRRITTPSAPRTRR